MPEWIDTETGAAPTDREVQQLISAERGHPGAGQRRRWLRPDVDAAVLISDEAGLRLSADGGVTAPTPPIVVGTQAGGALTGTYPNPTLVDATVDTLVPPGTIVAYAGATAPAGWLPCNGAAVERAIYSKLFAVIGIDYGDAGGNPALFNLPNYVGRVIVSESGAHPRGQTGGSETADGPPHTHPGSHTHDLNAHTHGLNNHTHGMGAHTHPSTGHAHGLNGHAHEVSLAHDHLVAPLTHPNGTGTSLGPNGAVAAGPYPIPDITHYHNFDVPAILPAAAPAVSLGPRAPIADTTTVIPAATGVPAPLDTVGPSISVSEGPLPAASAAASPAPAAVYPGTIAIMPPFGVARYIIRAGA